MIIEEHPELSAEQEYVLRAYDALRAMHERVAGFRNMGHEQLERLAFEEWRTRRLRELADDKSSLVFGRIDAGERYYIGRRHVEGAGGEVLVVDWRAPVSTAFYRASFEDPMGVRLRRHFLVDGARVLGLADEHLGESARAGGEAAAMDLLRAALERRHGGEMRDIVATIQAEQDRIIRAPLPGIVVVQGGPGTGKTAVGLHRAAFLVYEHRARLEKEGVLVIGPNRIFIRYVAQVLPSLGETTIDQRPFEALGPAVPLHDPVDAAAERIKGDVRMASVIARAVWDRLQPATDEIRTRYRSTGLRLTADELNAMMQSAADRALPYNTARERFVRAVHRELFRLFEGDTPSVMSLDEFSRAMRKDKIVSGALDAMWPRASGTVLVSSLLRSAARLGGAAEEILDDAEQKTLLRAARRAKRNHTRADLALFDEAGALIEGVPETFGHVIVDEAQDLSPMELRMIARRCPAGSMTILGDLAQGTSLWAHESWESLLRHVPIHEGARVEELTLGYRVSDEVMRLAAPILAAVRPSLTPPAAVRRGGSVRFAPSDPVRLADDAARLAHALAATADGAYAIIAPDALQPALHDALERAHMRYGEASKDALEAPVTLLAARDSKGLEFDGIVLVEPATIVDEEGDAGLARLYICVTRAMRDLIVVHARDLPPSMRAHDLQPVPDERAS